MWDIRRRIDVTGFPKRRVVLLFEFTDFMTKLRRWWLVIHRGQADLCRTDPGFDVDLKIECKLRTLTQVWMGDISLHRALKEKYMELTGDRELKNTMKSWFTLSAVAEIKPGG